MKLRFVLLIVVSFIVLTPLYAANSQQPKLELLTKDLDVGEVQKNQLLDIKIKVRNAGTKDLVIENVYSSCGCFQVNDPRWPNNPNPSIKLPKPVILKPGAKISISAAFDTNKVIGQFEKSLHIISNDPVVKDAVWRIKGTVLDSSRQENVGTRSNNIAQYPSSGANKVSEVEKPMSDAKVVMLFYTTGCNECSEIRDKFLPGIKDKYKEKILIVEYNIDNPESFAFLIDLQNKYDEKAKKGFFNPKPPAVFIEKRFLYGVKEIEEKLEKLLE